MAIKIYGDASKVQSTIISGGGTPNYTLKEWFDYSKGMETNHTTVKDGIATLVVEDVSSVSLEAALLAISEGFEIEGMPLVIEMTEAKYDNQVIAGVPERTTVNEEGVETVLKWDEWKKSNMEHYHIGDKHYIPTNAGIKTRYMNGSEFINVYGKEGYKLLTMVEFSALLPVVADE